MSGTALAISATRIDPELRRGSPSVWPLRFPPTGRLPAAPHESSAPANGIRMRAGRPRSRGGEPMAGQVQIRILQKAPRIIGVLKRSGEPMRPLLGQTCGLRENEFPRRQAASHRFCNRPPWTPFVPLRRSSWPFVDIFLPFRPSWISSSPYPTFGGPLSIPLQPLRAPSSFFVSLRGNLFAFSPFVDIFFPLSDLRRPPLDPPPTPSWPFVVLRGPSWISFVFRGSWWRL